MNFKNLSTNHHAFLIPLEGKASFADTLSALSQETRALFGGRTIITQSFLDDPFLVEQARKVRLAQESKLLENERRIIIIGSSSMTIPAQNTLLKVLEEPSHNTYFFIITPSRSLVLETIRSRCVNIEVSVEKEERDLTTDSFLKKGLGDRLEATKIILEDRLRADKFFKALEEEIARDKRIEDFASKKIRQLLNQSKYYTQNGSPAAKYLLEELALTLPLRESNR